MTPQLEKSLRKSLDEVDRKRKLTAFLTGVLLLIIVSDAIATVVWTADARTTLACGLLAVMCLVALGTVKVGQISYDNTRRILKAIELLSEAGNHDRA